jgi:hypothetical protein
MDEITKNDFLENFKEEFTGNDENGYDYKGIFIKESDLSNVTDGIANDLNELEEVIAKEDDDDGELTEINNKIMAYIFGDGDDFQGSFEEELESGDYCWYLDFGDIQVDRNKNGFNYTGVRLYKG